MSFITIHTLPYDSYLEDVQMIAGIAQNKKPKQSSAKPQPVSKSKKIVEETQGIPPPRG